MTREEAIKELKEDKMLYETDVCHAGDGTPDGRLLEALDMAIVALAVYPQFKWERDMAIEQLDEYGIPFGAKKDDDVVKVVRCKGCKHYSVEDETTQFGWCNALEMPTDEQRFCADGERREDG